ncbi:hypothetical protein BGW38_003433 [Lunasporangiospora selenospora]|uniref:FHF complex subunit HOOK-interacting protein C-terminal domain-containing protein n=1 Tax=Lunasporangiospora selenospora TaxID=979761 RepID=A0A9P6FRI2_9FUNG|nr:hypothetical protein BGW38_003433 [Lunasporangiospora selenospora]
MEPSIWNKLRKSVLTEPKAPPSSTMQQKRFHKCWQSIQFKLTFLQKTAITTSEKRHLNIQQTEIAIRLKNIVDLLVDEESRLEDASGATEVCMEYLLKNNILGKLVASAESDRPRGILGETIRTFASLINLLDDRFMVHNAVHKPTVKLLRTCCAPGKEFDGTESYHEDLIDLMYILCSKIHGYPELLNIFFYDRMWLTVPERVAARRRETIALLKTLGQSSGLAVATSIESGQNTALAPATAQSSVDDAGTSTEGSAQSTSSETKEIHSQIQPSNGFESKKDYEFLLFTYLSKFVHREGKSGDFARTGLLFLMELATGSLGEYILDSDFASYLTAGVGALYSQLPRKLIVKGTTNALNNNGANTSAMKSDSSDDSKPSRRANIEPSTSADFQSRLDAFLKVLEFCQDILVRCPNPEIAAALLTSFKIVFLENILYPSILECSDTDGSSVAVISYIDQILQVLVHEELVDLVVGFLMASDDEDDTRSKPHDATDDAFVHVQNPQTTSPYFMASGRFTLKDLVLSRLKSRSQPTVIATLRLLNTVITRHCKYSIKLLNIQPDNRATSFRDFPDLGAQELRRDTPAIRHHTHELDLFYALISTINPQNTSDIFCNGYPSYLGDAEGSIEMHQCFTRVDDKDNRVVEGVEISPAEHKKLRRRSMKYGHRLDEEVLEAALKQDCGCKKGSGRCHPILKHRLLPSDPLLQILLGILSHFFAHSTELNLALTGVISSLAICPYRSLEGWLLFKTSDIKKPAIDRGPGDDEESESPNDIPAAGIFSSMSPTFETMGSYDSDDEETLPIWLSREEGTFGFENGKSFSSLPVFKSFPPFFTMLRTLTQQVDYYRSEIDGFDDYLAERRRALCTPLEGNTNGIPPGASLDQQSLHGNLSSASTLVATGSLHGSKDSFSFSSSNKDHPGFDPRSLTPINTSGLASNLPVPSSPKVQSNANVGNGGTLGQNSKITSPTPQRLNTNHPISMVKISSPRARKSSSPSSLMSSPSNMSFLLPPGLAKRSFRSSSASPLAAGSNSPSSSPLTARSPFADDLSRAANTSLATVPQPRTPWASTDALVGSPKAAIGGMVGLGGNTSTTTLTGQGAALTYNNSGSGNGSTVSSGPGTGVHAGMSGIMGPNVPPYSHQMGVGNSSLSKIMETMKIKPLFPDCFIDDSDSEAHAGIDMEVETSEDSDTGPEDESPRLQSKQNTKPKHRRNSSMVKSGRRLTGQPQLPEKLVPLGQLLANVVILEEAVKEIMAVAQVRKGLGVDRVRFQW